MRNNAAAKDEKNPLPLDENTPPHSVFPHGKPSHSRAVYLSILIPVFMECSN